MRAVLVNDRSSRAELAFSYEGPSTTTAHLADGELRRQIGLKLRAQDSCNVVYVMWHMEPSPGVVVSVKHDRTRTKHSECGDGGYVTIKPDAALAAPRIERGVQNVLHAELVGTELRVLANGAEVWHGHLPETALAFDGPAGVRTDNGIFDFELRVPAGRAAHGTCTTP